MNKKNRPSPNGKAKAFVIKNDLGKLEIPPLKRSGMHVQSQGKPIFVPPTRGGREGKTRVFGS